MHDTRLRDPISPSTVCCCACALSCADGWHLRVYVPQVALLVKPTLGTVPDLSHMQKERLQFIQVRAKPGIERATSLCVAARIACVMGDGSYTDRAICGCM